MSAFEKLHKAVDAGLARIEWEQDHCDLVWDIPEDAQPDADGNIGPFLGDSVRRLRSGELQSMICTISVREPECSHCLNPEGWRTVASLAGCWVGSSDDRSAVEEGLAEECERELDEVLSDD